jgi:predicted nucleic acid-binding protein
VIVVDANVLAHLQLPGVHTPAAEVLLKSDPDWAAPILWRSEFRNILAGYLRRGVLTLDQACRIQDETEDLMRETEYEVDSASALRLLPDSDCSAYDCEYVALATTLGVSLVTRDKRVLRAFPGIAVAL